MPTPGTDSTPADPREEALRNVEEAHRLLNTLRSEIDRHPNLEAAIVRLELALEKLTINTGGML